MSKWNLKNLYSSQEEWQKDFEKLKLKLNDLDKYKGKLSNIHNLKAHFRQDTEVTAHLYKIYLYIHLKGDLDLKDEKIQADNQKLRILLSEFYKKTSFVSPELISIGKENLFNMIHKEQELKKYLFPMTKLFHSQEHILDDKQEKLIANFSISNSLPSLLHQSLSIIDREDEIVTLSSGEKVKVNSSNWSSIIKTLSDSIDRRKIFEATFKRYSENKTAFAATYQLVLNNLKSNYESRNYTDSLHSVLFKNNIPKKVFLNLIDVARENTASVKKFIKLKKKYLGMENYYTYDRFLSLSRENKKYTYEESKDLFLKSIENLDSEFVKFQKNALEDGYVDAYPKEGKRTGAYSSGVYGHHPYILLNHDQTLSSVMTLAHEAGHSAHTLFSNLHQPMPTSDYTIFIAEIASTFNEHILLDYLFEISKSKSEKIQILEVAINRVLSTFFRQTLFANYEYLANKKIAEGQPITSDSLSKIMIDLYKHYYDIDIEKEKFKKYVWAYIPHLFRTPFYVYQYATSFSASLKIFENIKNKVPGAMTDYKNMLKSGGNDFPVNQAKIAGVDLTDKNTFLSVVNYLEDLIKKLDLLLNN